MAERSPKGLNGEASGKSFFSSRVWSPYAMKGVGRPDGRPVTDSGEVRGLARRHALDAAARAAHALSVEDDLPPSAMQSRLVID